MAVVTVNSKPFILPFAVFDTFTPQHLIVVPQKECCVFLLHAFLHAYYFCSFFQTEVVSHLPTSSHAVDALTHRQTGDRNRTPQGHKPMVATSLTCWGLLVVLCHYIWFIPVLDLHRAHKAMHGNTPGSHRKTSPPPLVPPPPMSPPSARQKRKPTQLDYTDDISVGSTRPSPSPKAKTHSAPTKTPRSPPPSSSPLLSSPQIQLDELGTPIHSKPKRSFLSATTTTAATTITTGTAATAAAPKITAATTAASFPPPPDLWNQRSLPLKERR